MVLYAHAWYLVHAALLAKSDDVIMVRRGARRGKRQHHGFEFSMPLEWKTISLRKYEKTTCT